MQIDSKVLAELGGTIRTAKKGETIFAQGDYPHFYFQIIEGKVKMISTTSEGKEYIQGIFTDGESFGEPPLFVNEVYPASAIASSFVNYYRLPVSVFFEILEQNPSILMIFTRMFARRIYNKTLSVNNLITNTPKFRIFGMLKNYKKQNCITDERVLIPFTRQEIAHFTGLRVETVIRTLRIMKEEKKVIIENRKLYF